VLIPDFDRILTGRATHSVSSKEVTMTPDVRITRPRLGV